MSNIRYRLKSTLFHFPLRAWDAVQNVRQLTDEPRILITRLSAKRAYVFREFLAWVTVMVPELRRRMEFQRLPYRVRDWSRFGLHVSWAGDTFDTWTPRIFQNAQRLADDARAHGVPVLNPVEHLANTGKSRGAALMASAGVRTPRCVRISDGAAFRRDFAGLPLPILIREERGHGRPSLMIDRADQLRDVDFSQFQEPLAAEFIDTANPRDGLYRKYRYVAVGDQGITRHMQANTGWEVRAERRQASAALRDEELAYLNQPDPHHAALQRARRALGLDIVGFDYSLDHDGQVVVWEANSFLNLNRPKPASARHIFPAVERAFALVARHYLGCAGAPIPAKIDELLAGYVSGIQDLNTSCPAPDELQTA